LLKLEIENRRVGRVWVSGTCDPYQPLEKKYELTRKCLEILSEHAMPVTVQTKSPLVLRDLELLRKTKCVEVGFSIGTADEGVRRMFEPNLPPIDKRVEALEKLHSEDIRTFAMIAPVLPRAEGLVKQLKSRVDYVLIDRMNYHHADWVYRKFKLEYAMTNGFFNSKKNELAEALEKERIPFQLLF